MAKLVLAAGTSHSPVLGSPPEDYIRHGDRDRARKWHLNTNGTKCRFSDLVDIASENVLSQLTPAVLKSKAEHCAAAIDRIRHDIEAAYLDALIIVGDDQMEQYQTDNMPAFLIYGGEHLINMPLSLSTDAPKYWRKARQQFHELTAPRSYPVARNLARYLVKQLISNNFDLSFSSQINEHIGEGHAFGFVHRQVLKDTEMPVVPVILNTYFPPNQPHPKRCYELGKAIVGAIESWSPTARIGIIASGGLSHFTIDETLDRSIMAACRCLDSDFWPSIPVRKLNSGSSEIRNWITVAGAAENLTPAWQVYEPCYRTEAGTGCGMGFAVWKDEP